MASSGYKFGLNIPKKASKPPQLKESRIFCNDDDVVDEPIIPKTSLRISAHANTDAAAETKRKALEEDPLLFDYDASMEQLAPKKPEMASAREPAAKTPKYMDAIIERAKARKLELEWIKERQMEKERRAEGNAFKDKDQFVTSAYKKQLEEKQKLMSALLEKDKKDQEENKSAEFYVHILKQNNNVVKK